MTTSQSLPYKRRQFLQMGISEVSLFATGLLAPAGFAASAAPFTTVSGFGPLQAPEQNGIMLTLTIALTLALALAPMVVRRFFRPDHVSA